MNKSVTMVIVLLMILPSLCQPLPAKVRRGATAEVTMADGREVKGELLAVKSDALLVFDRDARMGKTIEWKRVDRVRIVNKTKFGEGVLIGLGAGLGVGALSRVTSSVHDKQDALLMTWIATPQLVLLGGVFGALSGMDKVFSLAGQESEIDGIILERLNRYARERNGLDMATADREDRSLFPENFTPRAPYHPGDAGVGQEDKSASLKGAGAEKREERIGKMILGGIVGNLAGILGGWKIGDALSSPHPSDHIGQVSPLGAMAGSVLGSALGVFAAGSSREARGNFGSALAGSLLGMATAVVVSLPLIGMDSGVGVYAALAAIAVLPPVGAATHFNRSLRSRPLPAGNALLSFSRGRLGLGIPDIHVRPLFVPGTDRRPGWRFSARVLSLAL